MKTKKTKEPKAKRGGCTAEDEIGRGMKNKKNKVCYLLVGMPSDEMEWLYGVLKPMRSLMAMDVKRRLRNRIESASWAMTGKPGDTGASIP